jgi:hypothetical protein
MKLQLGMRLRPQSLVGPRNLEAARGDWDGVVVYFVPPDAKDHGVVATWLENQTGYGGDNCEHYAYYADEDLDDLFTTLS